MFQQFKVIFSNVDTFNVCKLQELKARLSLLDDKPAIIALSEVKAKNFKFERSLSEFNIEGYEIIHVNFKREDKGRCMLIYIQESLKYNQIHLNLDFTEYACIEVIISGTEKLLFANIYRSPNSDKINNDRLNMLFKTLVDMNYTHILVNGDFNYPGIDWDICDTKKGPGDSEYEFLETVRDCFFHQHVHEFTRGRGRDIPTVIDLVFSNEEGMVSDLEVEAPLGKSDHCVIKYCFNFHTSEANSEKTIYKYDKADWDKMRALMNIDWETQFKDLNVNDKWIKLKQILINAVEDCVPKVTVKRNRKNKVRQSNRRLISKIKQKQRLWNRYVKKGDENARIEYNRVRNQIRNITRKMVKEYEKKIAESSKANPKSFWNYVQKKTKTKTSISDLYTDESKETMTNSDKQKANVLAEFFSSVFTVDNDIEHPSYSIPDGTPLLDSLKIDPKIVEKKLRNLKISKSPGPDKIHPRVLHDLGKEISIPLSLIFSSSWEQGEIPEEWRCGNITALFKKGDRKAAGNYRPVSLTCIACKLMEGIVREGIVTHMQMNKLFSNKQYGFISGRSTVLQLLTVIDKWTEALDKGHAVDVAYCDFMKAFDKVSHPKLIHKLKMYNFGENYVKWITAFFNNRKQRVVIDWKDVTSGIPQGSVLGPICFVLYINDLPSSISKGSEVFLFADDTKIY